MSAEIDTALQILLGPDLLTPHCLARRYPKHRLLKTGTAVDHATVIRHLYVQYRDGTLCRGDDQTFFRLFSALAGRISVESAISYEEARTQIWRALA